MVWRRSRKSGGAGSSSASPGRRAGAGEDEKRAPRGHVPMVVAGRDDEGVRVMVPVRLLSDPRIAELLDMAAERYGYAQPGVLRVPCDAGHFRRLVDGAMQRCGVISAA